MKIDEQYEVKADLDNLYSSYLYIGESVGKNQAVLGFRKQNPEEGIGYRIKWIGSSVPGGVDR